MSDVSKPWFASKTLWANAFALVAVIAQLKWGWVVPPEAEMGFFGIVNIVLRAVTKSSLY